MLEPNLKVEDLEEGAYPMSCDASLGLQAKQFEPRNFPDASKNPRLPLAPPGVKKSSWPVVPAVTGPMDRVESAGKATPMLDFDILVVALIGLLRTSREAGLPLITPML